MIVVYKLINESLSVGGIIIIQANLKPKVV